MTVDESRPLAAALLALEPHLGVVLNYEDAPIVFSGDATDVASSVMTSEQRAAHPEAKVIVPRPGKLTWSLPEESRSLAAVKTAVESMVTAYNSTGLPGRFEAQSSGTMFFIVPTAVRGVSGALTTVRPLLSQRITIPTASRSMGETVALIIQLLTHDGTSLVIGTAPFGLFANAQVSVSANNEPARNVLAKLLAGASSGVLADGTPAPLLGYRLMCDPVTHSYVLNIHKLTLPKHPLPTGGKMPPQSKNPYIQ